MHIHKAITFGVSLFACTVAFGGSLALVPTGGTVASDGRSFMLGWQFSVSTPITIDGLSYFDAGNDGLTDSHRVGIFDNGTSALLVSATIPSGTGATLVGGFRTVAVSFTLNPGTYVIGGQSLTASDGFLFTVPTVTTAPGVTYLAERELGTASFVMPTAGPFSEKGIFGPNFTITAGGAVPEPGTFSLIFIAGVGLVAVGRRRLSSRT